MNSQVVLPLCYFPPIGWWVQAMKHQQVLLDGFEYHIKQSYRSRCKILAVHGPQTLSVVTDNRGSKSPMKETTLVDYDPWRKVHVKALESAYYSSPYYEYFQEEVQSIIQGDFNSLLDLNKSSILWVNKVMQLGIDFRFTDEFKPEHEGLDLRPGKRNEFIEVGQLPEYNQVFKDKRIPFEPNLSILDLLFNLGLEGRLYLKRV